MGVHNIEALEKPAQPQQLVDPGRTVNATAASEFQHRDRRSLKLLLQRALRAQGAHSHVVTSYRKPTRQFYRLSFRSPHIEGIDEMKDFATGRRQREVATM